MSIASYVLGQSGTGKTASLRNMDPSQTLLIQVIPKPLPFRQKDWRAVGKDGGNILVLSRSDQICEAMKKTSRPIIVIDDFQYLLSTEYMARAHEKGYEKFTEMGRHYFDVLKLASELSPEKRVYMISHTETTESGQTQAKLIGKLLSEKITVEGMVSIVVRTHVVNGRYVFSTRNNGSDTVKTPISLFEDEFIDNDLAAVDRAIVNFYSDNFEAA